MSPCVNGVFAQGIRMCPRTRSAAPAALVREKKTPAADEAVGWQWISVLVVGVIDNFLVKAGGNVKKLCFSVLSWL